MAHNPECGLDCVSAGAVRRPSADANQQTGRRDLSGDQSAEQAKLTYVEAEYLSHDAPGYSHILSEGGILETYEDGNCDWVVEGEIEPRYGRLFAAAPEMYEALKALATKHMGLGNSQEWADALAVIAKAEGRDR